MQPKEREYITIPELAKILGLSRIAVFKKVKSGEIKAIRIGRNYAISKKTLDNLLGNSLEEENKREIDKAVEKTVAEYGQTLKLLGKD
ncbi:MAG: helix-turn-helix domain-containing protein [Candidatus Omnitrophica bacterium]|nr:helix-turn-helix domain-containing protein [Candidatus Omnitrophota bacterium]MBU1905989.1 helix-turn-helix domain-containing protein [Candidatus Omnitrophota bacterium]